MPVRIEQPAPQAPDITAGGAAAAQFARDLPSLAGLYEASGRNAAAVLSAGMGATAQLQAARLSAQAHDNASARAAALRQAELELSQRPSERDEFMIESQMALQNQRAANAAWLNQQEVSQQEAMQLRRDQNAVGYVQQAMADGILTPDQGNDLITQLRTRIDPVRQRLESQEAKRMAQQTQAMMHDNAQRQALMGQDGENQAQALQKRATTVQFADGTTAKFVVQPDGKLLQVKDESAGDVMMERQIQFEEKAREFDLTKFTKAFEHAQKMALADPEAANKPTLVDDYMKKLLGTSNLDVYLERESEKRHASRLKTQYGRAPMLSATNGTPPAVAESRAKAAELQAIEEELYRRRFRAAATPTNPYGLPLQGLK